MQLDGAFRVLLIPLLLIIHGSAEIVLPPTNLTLSCDNLNVTARWNYKHPNTKFMVKIHGDPGTKETTDHHYDLSPFVWKSEKNYLDVHSVSITAIQGGKQSSPVNSKTLAYNDLKLSNIKCKLDFPAVELKVVDQKGVVTFRNPFDFYKELRQAAKSNSALFEFSIITKDRQNITVKCPVHQKYCQKEIFFPEGESQCVTLKGELCDVSDYRCVVFNERGPICPDESTVSLWILIGVLLSVVFIVVSGLTFFICLTKSWTFRKEEAIPPKPLVQPLTDHMKPYFTPDKNDYSAVILIDDKTCEISSLSSDEEDPQDSGDSRYGSGTQGYKEGGFLEGLKEGYRSTDDDSANDSLKTESDVIDMEVDRGEENGDLLFGGPAEKELEEDEEDIEVGDRSPYDCKHNPLEDFHKV